MIKNSVIILLLFYCLPLTAQINNQNLKNLQSNKPFVNSDDKFHKSVSINVLTGLFLPIHFDDEYYTASGFTIGLQNNTSELLSLCLNYEMVFTKSHSKIYYYNEVKPKYILRLEFGTQFNYLNLKDWKFFAAPYLGIMTIGGAKSETLFSSLLPVSFALETGTQYKLSDKISLRMSARHNSFISAGIDNGETFTFMQFNGGISIRL